MALGLVTGLTLEARAITARAPSLPGDRRPMIFCAGANGAAAALGARDMIDKGAEALVSIGLAGGLAPRLKSGTVMLPRQILAGDNEPRPVETNWRGRAQDLLDGFALADGAVVTVDEPVVDPALKAALFEETGAAAVDMESWYVADAAAEAGIPFLALRIVADTASHRVPEAAIRSMKSDGEIDRGAVLRRTLAAPGTWPSMIALAWASGKALGVLRRVGALGLPFFGLVDE